MKKQVLAFAFALACTFTAFSQNVAGKWKTFDDKTGEAKSIVEITETNGKLQAKIIEILNPAKKNAVCTECKGADKGKKLEGLTIIKNLNKDGNEFSGGKILDPTNGKEYSCIIKLNANDKNKLDVRGYIGMAFAGRTQHWIRVQ